MTDPEDLWREFVRLVLVHFAFLEKGFGMTCTIGPPPRIVYESSAVVLHVYYDVYRSGELDAFVLRATDAATVPGVGLSEMALARGEAPEQRGTAPFVGKVIELEREVPILAAQVFDYGQDLLRDDPAAWGRIRVNRERHNDRRPL